MDAREHGTIVNGSTFRDCLSMYGCGLMSMIVCRSLIHDDYTLMTSPLLAQSSSLAQGPAWGVRHRASESGLRYHIATRRCTRSLSCHMTDTELSYMIRLFWPFRTACIQASEFNIHKGCEKNPTHASRLDYSLSHVI